jgi:hypothetical protein
MPVCVAVIGAGDVLQDTANIRILDGKFCGAGPILGREAALLAAALSAPHGPPRVVDTNTEAYADLR